MSWLLKYTLLEEERHRLHKLEMLIDGACGALPGWPRFLTVVFIVYLLVVMVLCCSCMQGPLLKSGCFSIFNNALNHLVNKKYKKLNVCL